MRAFLRSALRKHGILIALLLIALALSLASPAFRRPANLTSLVRQTSVSGIMAVGMTFVILTGGIDLSVGSTLALTGILCAASERAGWPVPLSLAATLLAGAGIGLANGLIITQAKVTPFVVTLGTMSILRGLSHIATGSEPISSFDSAFRWLGSGSLGGVPVPILIFLGAVLLGSGALNRTRFGRYVLAIGGNEQAAWLSGIPVDFHKTMAYVVCGLTAALAAAVLTARLNAAESIAGMGYELDVIAAVVIGGTSLVGGRGSVWGTLIGALLIGTIDNGMTLLAIQSYYQMVVKGAIIIAAVVLDRLRD